MQIIGFEGAPVVGGVSHGRAVVRDQYGRVWTTAGDKITDTLDARVAAGTVTMLSATVEIPEPECGPWTPTVVCIASGGLIDAALTRSLLPHTCGTTGDPEYRFLVFHDAYTFTTGARAAVNAVKSFLTARRPVLDVAYRLIDAGVALTPDDTTLLAIRATLALTQAYDAHYAPTDTMSDPFIHRPYPGSEEEHCRICGHLAAHKIAEEGAGARHPYTAYLCCTCFGHVFGTTAERWCAGDSIA
jgi:hypothetical protein